MARLAKMAKMSKDAKVVQIARIAKKQKWLKWKPSIKSPYWQNGHFREIGQKVKRAKITIFANLATMAKGQN